MGDGTQSRDIVFKIYKTMDHVKNHVGKESIV